MESSYAPSFLAGYRTQIARLWCLWSHTFSPAVVLSSVVTHTTSRGVQSKITSAALAESCRFSNVVANLIVNTNSHGQAVKLFKDASTYRTYAGNFLVRVLQKAEHAHKTSTPVVDHDKDTFKPSTYELRRRTDHFQWSDL
ncbi:hypothetical protein PISMIDRAFT_206107 [Pisolithus microcarpus 441]|uniref:Uncharacterized protein n=1 Tax=Pisolithus microcarpus 441 TaxID=765257 RepID=A0A0C9ZN28_9AGAM|nr:hypothetical protein BKA83DRAFT_206107 [Pisolithus microcarpus]KIK27319.1 hypothetical protein PISMIDRAFT_206107 [Pisolithus microcarpus 441]